MIERITGADIDDQVGHVYRYELGAGFELEQYTMPTGSYYKEETLFLGVKRTGKVTDDS